MRAHAQCSSLSRATDHPGFETASWACDLQIFTACCHHERQRYLRMLLLFISLLSQDLICVYQSRVPGSRRPLRYVGVPVRLTTEGYFLISAPTPLRCPLLPEKRLWHHVPSSVNTFSLLRGKGGFSLFTRASREVTHFFKPLQQP